MNLSHFSASEIDCFIEELCIDKGFISDIVFLLCTYVQSSW